MSEESETRRLQDLITEAVTKCDRCGREMLPGDLDCEYQERIATFAPATAVCLGMGILSNWICASTASRKCWGRG